MPKILIESYSTFYDQKTDVQFSPVLDRRSGCRVGVAETNRATAALYEGRPAFRVLTDAEYLAMTTAPAEADEPEPETGDPLLDQQETALPDDLDALDYKVLQGLAKARGLKAAGVSKTDLAASLRASVPSGGPPPPPSS